MVIWRFLTWYKLHCETDLSESNQTIHGFSFTCAVKPESFDGNNHTIKITRPHKPPYSFVIWFDCYHKVICSNFPNWPIKKITLFSESDTDSRADKPVALISARSNWNLECWFLTREENWRTRRKTLGAGTITNNKLNPHVTLGPGMEPRPQRWEASALTTAPSQLL